ncbi:hypothetical protein F5J12DRAFT_781067, partial [Pisolithus orientalis]|uniref:uncharacterized protein n=1 Tax=Pisolithus orientalis TaxID=936130 RepID=UPI002225AF30
AAHLAKEWNERKPPPKAQAEVATSKGQKYAKQFAYDMWKQCGMRVVIMLAWKDKEGEVMVGVNDFNDKLGDGELYSDWEDLHGKWSAYTKKAFGANGMEDGSREDEAGLACGKMNASVPWAAIADNQASYVASKYLPPNIPFKEPTRLTHHELIKTLEFWKE